MQKENVFKDKMMESKKFISGENRMWEPFGPGISRQIMGYSADLMTVRVKFEKGGIAAMHAHPHTQTSTIVSGVYEFEVDGEKMLVKEGDGVLILPDQPHQCLCLEPGIVIDNFSPAREDFLK